MTVPLTGKLVAGEGQMLELAESSQLLWDGACKARKRIKLCEVIEILAGFYKATHRRVVEYEISHLRNSRDIFCYALAGPRC